MIKIMLHARDEKEQAEPKSVSLTTRDIEDAARLLALLCNAQYGSQALAPAAPKEAVLQAMSEGSTRPNPSIDRARLTGRAKKILTDRRRRENVFGKSMFGEPAWDMLLILYVAEQSGPRFTIGRLTRRAGASATTTLRWLEYLESQNLVGREEHPTDRRAIFVGITEMAREQMDLYLSETFATEA